MALASYATSCRRAGHFLTTQDGGASVAARGQAGPQETRRARRPPKFIQATCPDGLRRKKPLPPRVGPSVTTNPSGDTSRIWAGGERGGGGDSADRNAAGMSTFTVRTASSPSSSVTSNVLSIVL